MQKNSSSFYSHWLIGSYFRTSMVFLFTDDSGKTLGQPAVHWSVGFPISVSTVTLPTCLSYSHWIHSSWITLACPTRILFSQCWVSQRHQNTKHVIWFLKKSRAVRSLVLGWRIPSYSTEVPNEHVMKTDAISTQRVLALVSSFWGSKWTHRKWWYFELRVQFRHVRLKY